MPHTNFSTTIGISLAHSSPQETALSPPDRYDMNTLLHPDKSAERSKRTVMLSTRSRLASLPASFPSRLPCRDQRRYSWAHLRLASAAADLFAFAMYFEVPSGTCLGNCDSRSKLAGRRMLDNSIGERITDTIARVPIGAQGNGSGDRQGLKFAPNAIRKDLCSTSTKMDPARPWS